MKRSLRRLGGRLLDRIVSRLSGPVERRLRESQARRALRAFATSPLCGVGIEVKGRLTLTGGQWAAIGNNVHIGDNAYIRAEGGLVIGDNTHISRNVTICTVNHDYEGWTLPYDERLRERPVTIGRDVWIGTGASITPGSRIGDGAVVGMGGVVAGNVPLGSVVVAPKTRILGRRDEAHYKSLRKTGQFGGARGYQLDPTEVAAFAPTIDDVRPFFVVSTGRSGSLTIARTLSQHPDVTCLHEPRAQLIQMSAEWAHGLRDPDAVRADLDAIYTASVCRGPIFGESDQNLSVLLDPLLARLPEARVIWLIRDGRDFVASAVRKGWYGGGPPPDGRRPAWDMYRLRGDLCGDVPTDTWGSMSAFERVCWYWSYVNRTIANRVESLREDRWRRVHLENLASEVPSLLNFLGAFPYPATIKRHNAGGGTAMAWSTAEARTFERLCGSEMDRWYPAWRSDVPDLN